MSEHAGSAQGQAELYAALVVAQKAAHAVPKGDRNEWHKYDYASSEDVITEARRALNAAGLALLATSSEVGGTPEAATVHVVYRLVHSSGEACQLVYDCPAVSDKGRPPDKAVAAARTYCLAYCLRDLLLLPRVEAGTEVDQRDDRAHEPPKRERARKREAPTEPSPAPLDVDVVDAVAAGFVDAVAAGFREQLEAMRDHGTRSELAAVMAAIARAGLPDGAKAALRGLAQEATDAVKSRGS